MKVVCAGWRLRVQGTRGLLNPRSRSVAVWAVIASAGGLTCSAQVHDFERTVASAVTPQVSTARVGKSFAADGRGYLYYTEMIYTDRSVWALKRVNDKGPTETVYSPPLSSSLQLIGPVALASDQNGTIFAAANGAIHRHREGLAPEVIVTAPVHEPAALTVDRNGTFYFISQNAVYRAAQGATAELITNHSIGFSGDGGPAFLASFNRPSALAVDLDGNLFVADTGNQRIRKITREGRVSTVAGGGRTSCDTLNGMGGPCGDCGAATEATLVKPTGLAVEPDGAILIADSGVPRIRRIDAAGRISTIVGSDLLRATPLYLADLRDLLGKNTMSLLPPATSAIAIDTRGHVYLPMGDGFMRISKNTAAPAAGCTAAIVNAANFRPGGVAPGEILTIFGEGLYGDGSWRWALGTDGLLQKEVVNTQVYFDEEPAVLIAGTKNQISAVVPYSVIRKNAVLCRVRFGTGRTLPFHLPIVETAPGIFPGAIFNEDGSQNTVTTPAAPGSVISLYATGAGQTDPGGVDGRIAGDALPRPISPVFVRIGDQWTDVLYAGASWGSVAGVTQVNARVPGSLKSGRHPVELAIGRASSGAGEAVHVR